MKQLENFLYIAILGLVGLFGMYLQNLLLDEEIEEENYAERHDPDYIQYLEGSAPRHTYSDSGWMNSSGDEILMTGNVRVVVEADENGPGGTLKSKRARILLDKNNDEDIL